MKLVTFLEGFVSPLPDVNSLGVTEACDGIAGYYAAQKIRSGRTILFLVADEACGLRLENDINNMAEKQVAKFFPAGEFDLLPVLARSGEDEHRRLEVLDAFGKKECNVLIATPESLQQDIMDESLFSAQCFEMKKGSTLNVDEFSRRLIDMGYEACEFVESVGQFAVRGGIVDIFSPGVGAPVRIELFDDEIDNIFDVNPFSNRRGKLLESVRVLPAKEQSKCAKIWNYLPKDFDLFVFDCNRLRDRLESETLNKLNGCKKVVLEPTSGMPNLFTVEKQVNISGATLRIPKLNLLNVWEAATAAQNENMSCLILAKNEKNKEALVKFLNTKGVLCRNLKEVPAEVGVGVWVTCNSLSSCFRVNEKIVVLNYPLETGNSQRFGKRIWRKTQMIQSLSDLNVGDKVVHIRHGIGIFAGLVQMEVGMITKDYIKLEYAENDVLYLPATQLDMISKYIGASSAKLHRLNGKEWGKVKLKAKKAASDFAKELVSLYAHRAQVEGHSFAKNDWQQEFELAFEFEETEDQKRCIAEIEKDMEEKKPMDRLLCGDVGVGKTEVALRAAFKCVMDSRQAMIIAPTTILAWQHFSTALERFMQFPVKIELLSRFRSPREQKEILKSLENGEIDIIVGTHRLLQKDVAFANLGLVIVDEEQRFGVRHKERIKEFRRNVDLLSISATPIPRTLNMVMMGMKDISTIDLPPLNRFPVKTFVLEYDEEVLKEAIRSELKYGGQVFFLYNKVAGIYERAAKLQKLMGEKVRIIVAHGQMSQEAMQDSWQKLLAKEADVLVCTTIIETGIDIPNCNTLIVEDAQNFGLSQLHQLRGRVGRSERKGFAYMFIGKNVVLSDVASQRLETLKEFAQFGAGFKIARRDLEIRGTGNILGEEQHGHMNRVGYEMYMKLLNEAIACESGEDGEKFADCLVDLDVTAIIPESYVRNVSTRLGVYKRIAELKTDEEIATFKNEIKDIHGQLPMVLLRLFDVVALKNKAKKLHISEIKQLGESLNLFFNVGAGDLALTRLKENERICEKHNKVGKYLAVKLEKGENNLEVLNKVLDAALDTTSY
ncbi:transcription-repair coupling factor [Clostridia bacterium]|nr:transcription-repair coupling factor [Clostridia bacterium]